MTDFPNVPTDETDRLLGLAENETGYAQKQAIADLRKHLGRPLVRQGPALAAAELTTQQQLAQDRTFGQQPIDRGPYQDRTPEEIAAGLPAGERPSNFALGASGPFQIGDMVVLNAGGPTMRVDHFESPTEAVCIWTDEHSVAQQKAFALDTLRHTP